uniref:Uncharacterized protein n=1 Tax=Kalanchoe fedtschenkoi TaxID=63787 RepID=A0A7N0TVX8_KALFE
MVLLVYSLAQNISAEVKALAMDEIMMAWGADKEFKKLENTMKTLCAVILDAEEQQNENNQVKDWLSKLRDVMCDVDDVVDDCSTEAMKLELDRPRALFFYSKTVANFFPQFIFNIGMAHKIKSIRETLTDISNDKQSLHLETKAVTWVNEVDESHSAASLGIVGRQAEKNDVVDILINKDPDKKLTCHAIVGIGGLGKTSLAKLVYNDQRIENEFQKRIWVHVSPNFNLKKIIRRIVGMEESEEVIKSLSLENLRQKLREKIQGERILLVLDDVWLENFNQWCELKVLLMASGAGSKVLVTTRNQSIVRIVGADNIYNLRGLSDDDCWYLLAASAFGSGHVHQEIKYPNLVTIGKQIAKKDEGVPLVVTTLGGMLSGNTDEETWLHVQHEDIWKMNEGTDQIMPILRLSFNVLPSYVKQCFIYCSIYLKRQQMQKETLKQLWIAQGFIQSSGQMSVEEVANRCFDLLISKSFIQDVEEDDYRQSTVGRMHDLVHDFACFISKNDGTTIDFEETVHVPESTRHISFIEPPHGTPGDYDPKSILGLKRIRTLFWAPASGTLQPDTRFPINLFVDTFQGLRVLHLFGMQIEVLPSSIGNQKHLRYLSLSGNTSIRRLPESITKLYKLETLRLDKCSALEELPVNIAELPNLNHLYITTKQKELKLLKMIRFVVSFRTLFVDDCEFLEVLPGCSERFKHVERLRFTNCPNAKVMNNIMEGMTKLRQVTLARLPNMIFIPRSLKDAALTLQTLHVSDCQNLIELPEWLASCRYLHRLTIINCPKVKSLPEGLEMLYGLKVLKISRCPGLTDQCEREHGQDWQKIARVDQVYLDGFRIN